jgi:serine protease Do
MKFLNQFFVLSLFSLACLQVSADEVIELKNGHSITGEVIKERGDEIIVDIGIDILRVSKSSSQRRRSTDDMGNAKEVINKSKFFLSGKLPKGTVRSLSSKFGESVVMVQTTSGLGSGFIINKDGYCVTNNHVIDGETKISVILFAKGEKENQPLERIRVEDVKIVAINPFFDLALLKIPAVKETTFKPVIFADDDDLVVGDPVFAIGSPLGLERSVSEGIIGMKNRNLNGLVYLQTTAQINPGNSGGPLFNLHGEVVGVNSMKISSGEGLGFSIPIHDVKQFLKNRDAFAYDHNNPGTGYRYLDPPRRKSRRKSIPSKPEASE